MAYRDLQAFLEKLDGMGELQRVRVEVDPLLEIAEITDRMSKSPHGGKALLFERVKGSGFPVATNLFGSYRRICTALEVGELSQLTRRMEEVLAPIPAASPRERIASLPHSPEFSRFLPRSVTGGSCQEIVDYAPDLGRYPILKNWAGDGRPGRSGRFITLPLVFTRDPADGTVNCGMYRVEAFGQRTAGIHWGARSGGAGHYGKYLSRGERMPVAIALGGDPAIICAASIPLPPPIGEMQFAGFLRQGPVEMVPCRTCEMWVPAHAEMVIEGYLDPGELARGGAFGNHTGYYPPPGMVPVVHITSITFRREMVYPATIVGPPPMEDCYMAKATERLMLPFLQLELPEVTDINLPLEGIFHGCAVIAIRKEHPGHAQEVMNALWAGGWLAGSRLMVVVDADVDVHDLSFTAWRVLNHVEWRRDTVIADSLPGEKYPPGGGRLGLDATRKMPGEGIPGKWPEETRRGESVRLLVTKRWGEYGFE